jgi:hypothetical protein
MTVPFGSDDLAAVIVSPDREWSGRALGVVKSWNPDTFENVISIRGTDIPDLPLQQPLLGLTLTPGAVVMLDVWKPRSGKGSAVYGISGQWLPVGAGSAAKAVAFMTSALAKNLSAEVFTERIHEASVDTSEGTGSATYTDLATTGPTVAGVEIVTGKALVLISGRIRAEQSASGNSESFMSFAVSGASTLAAADSRAASTWIRLSVHPTESHIVDVAMRGTAQVWLTGLNNGVHTFTAKYRTTGAASNFGVRAMTVITF